MRHILAIHADSTIPDGDLVNLEVFGQDSEIEMSLRDNGVPLDGPVSLQSATLVDPNSEESMTLLDEISEVTE